MASRNKIKVTDIDIIDKILKEYNNYVISWNDHEKKAISSLFDNKPTETFKYNGPLEIVMLNGRSTKSIGIYLDDNQNILYTIVTKRHSVYLAHSNLKSPLEKIHIANVWQEETSTSFEIGVQGFPKQTPRFGVKLP